MKKTWIGLAIMTLLCSCAQTRPAPNIQLNANPKKSYNFDVRFIENPGPVKNIDISAHYRVRDYCTPPQPVSGAVLPLEYEVKLAVKKIDDRHYAAVFHQDALTDDDYFGLGVCRWSLQNITVNFNSPTTRFTASISGRDGKIQPDVPLTQYYLNSDYFQKPEVSEVIFGESKDFYLKSLGPQFQVTLEAKNLNEK